MGKVDRLEDKGKGSFKLLEHGLYQLRKGDSLIGLRIVNVLDENRDSFGIRLGLELVTPLLQHEPELCAVGDDTVVDDAELAFGIGADGMAVDLRRGAMSSPASVCDGNLGYEGLVDIYRGCSDLFAQTGDFSDFFEEEEFTGFVTVDTQSSRVVASILLARKPITEDFENLLAALANNAS